MALVSLTVVMAKMSLEQVSFFRFLWLQMLVASVAMLLYTFAYKKEKIAFPLDKRQWLIVIAIGMLNYLLVRSLFIYALDNLTVVTHAYLMNFVGLATMLLSALVLKERPTKNQVLGGLIAVSGLWIYFLELPKASELFGVLALLIAVLSLAATNILIRYLHIHQSRLRAIDGQDKLMQPAGNNSPISSSTKSPINLLSNNQVATFAIVIGSLPIIILGWIYDSENLSMSLINWGIVFANGVIAVAFVMMVFTQVMQHLKAFEASVIATIGVIFSAAFSMIILQEQPAIYHYCGIALMLLGIGLVQWPAKTGTK
jgi:drug/metabolite transporter (DMT)-like permease